MTVTVTVTGNHAPRGTREATRIPAVDRYRSIVDVYVLLRRPDGMILLLERSGTGYADVDAALAAQWLRQADARTLLHGHTHRPAEHTLEAGLRRIVLSDWDADAQPPRLEVLRLSAAGVQRLNLA